MLRKLTLSEDIKKKNQVQKSIDQKKKVLSIWTEKIEMLRVNLELIEHEYNVRIGYLLLKDNQLDLEIIQLKNLKRLMDEGMSYEEAVRYEEDKFYNEILRMQEEQKKLDEEKEIFEAANSIPDEMKEEIKMLWKKLIRKFHPDLVQDKEEKQNREEIMKKINEAYTAGNLEALQHLLLRNTLVSIKQSTLEELEKELVEIENTLVVAREEWNLLKESEWFGWKKKIEKAKKTGEDVFAPLEKSLLDDITRKIQTAQKLRAEVHPQMVL